MIIDITNQMNCDLTLQPLPVKINTGSILALHIAGVPDKIAAENVTAVEVAITNPDGISAIGNAVKIGSCWYVRFSSSLFASYGTVLRGVKISVITATGPTVVFADLVVVAANADAVPGNPGNHYQTVGGDIYVKSEIVGGVQHYKRLTIGYNDRLGTWGFNDPEGDYILDANGNFFAVVK